MRWSREERKPIIRYVAKQKKHICFVVKQKKIYNSDIKANLYPARISNLDAINFLNLIEKLFINKAKTIEEKLYFIKFYPTTVNHKITV